MGTLLATSLLTVLLIASVSWTFFNKASQLRLARISSVPREFFPISRKSYSSAVAARANSHPYAARWAR
jgi:hypothetical protein